MRYNNTNVKYPSRILLASPCSDWPLKWVDGLSPIENKRKGAFTLDAKRM